MSGRPRTTSFAEGNKPPANPPLGGMKISSKYHNLSRFPFFSLTLSLSLQPHGSRRLFLQFWFFIFHFHPILIHARIEYASPSSEYNKLQLKGTHACYFFFFFPHDNCLRICLDLIMKGVLENIKCKIVGSAVNLTRCTKCKVVQQQSANRPSLSPFCLALFSDISFLPFLSLLIALFSI